MKRLLGILAIVSVLLFSCVEKQPESVVVEPTPLPFIISDTLLQIDTLLQNRPDSALMLLIEPPSFRAQRGISYTFNESYRNLLLSEALYKTYNTQYYRDNLQVAMRFFDSLAAQYPGNDDVAYYAARSHYMNGVGYYETDSVVAACREYLHALEIMEDHFDETHGRASLQGYKAKFMGLTYGRLGELFSDQFMMEPSIYCEKKLLFYCRMEPTSKYGLSNAIYHIGQNYDMLHQYDSACFYYNKAIESLPDSNNLVYRDIITNTSVLAYSMNHCADSSLLDIKRIMEQAADDDERLTRYISLGYIYYEEKKYDSALYYFENVFNNNADALCRTTSADYIYKIHQKLGDTIKSNFYAMFLASEAASKYDNMMNVSILDRLFNDYLEKHKQNQQYRNNLRNFFLTAIPLVFIISLVFVLLYRKNKKIKDSSQKYHTAKAKISMLEKRLVKMRSETELCYESFLNESICLEIHDMICDIPASTRSNYSDYPNLKLDDASIARLFDAVNKHFPNLKTKLLFYNIKLKRDDFLICYLYLLGLNNSQIALLRQCNYTTVYRQAERMEKSIKECGDLPTFIRKICIT